MRGRIERGFALVFVPEMSFKFLGLFQVRSGREYGDEVTVINHGDARHHGAHGENTAQSATENALNSVCFLCVPLDLY